MCAGEFKYVHGRTTLIHNVVQRLSTFLSTTTHKGTFHCNFLKNKIKQLTRQHKVCRDTSIIEL